MFICVDNNSDSSLSRRHAIRRSPHSRKKMAKDLREASFTEVDDFSDLTNPTEPVERQRIGSAVVESTHRDFSLGRQYRTKSLENVLETLSPDNVSELEKTVNLGPKQSSLDRFVAKEKVELESSKKVSPVVMRKAVDLQKGRDRRGTLFDDDDTSPLLLRHKHNITSGTAAAAAAAAAASKSEVCTLFSDIGLRAEWLS